MSFMDGSLGNPRLALSPLFLLPYQPPTLLSPTVAIRNFYSLF